MRGPSPVQARRSGRHHRSAADDAQGLAAPWTTTPVRGWAEADRPGDRPVRRLLCRHCESDGLRPLGRDRCGRMAGRVRGAGAAPPHARPGGGAPNRGGQGANGWEFIDSKGVFHKLIEGGPRERPNCLPKEESPYPSAEGDAAARGGRLPLPRPRPVDACSTASDGGHGRGGARRASRVLPGSKQLRSGRARSRASEVRFGGLTPATTVDAGRPAPLAGAAMRSAHGCRPCRRRGRSAAARRAPDRRQAVDPAGSPSRPSRPSRLYLQKDKGG